ncbi:serine hydrolase-like protein 2 isoform X2 [Hyperolius riggenbachi]|uniref:serine hydrolase-like protein 2 isoform X2 n=1 Tax=Hyperolius riggenbachi TaxID=752182 RepID=UPI0035A3905C
MSSFLKELQFKVPWGHLAAKAWGSHDGCPILCLHGWLDNANTFDRLIPLLPKEYHYVALDFSGHGRSSHLPQGMRYQHLDYVTDIHRVVTALGWRKFSILGHSMGGVVGGLFASVFPDTVQHLVLLDSYGFFPIPSDLLMSHLKRAILHYSRLNDANTAKVYTPEGALQRLLDGNPSLNTDTAKVLLQRGTKPVPDALPSYGEESGHCQAWPPARGTHGQPLDKPVQACQQLSKISWPLRWILKEQHHYTSLTAFHIYGESLDQLSQR